MDKPYGSLREETRGDKDLCTYEETEWCLPTGPFPYTFYR